MKKAEIRKGGLYSAKVNNTLTTVQVKDIREVEGGTRYDVVNLNTDRWTVFKSAAKFRGPANDPNYCDNCATKFAQPAESAPALCGACERAKQMSEEQAASREDEKRADPTKPTKARNIGATTVKRRATKPAPVEIADDTVQPDFIVNRANNAPMVSIASELRASNQGRTPGDVVAGMVPNDEQEVILDAASQSGLKVLVIGAGAGTGKTATLKMLEQILKGRGQYTAFNTALVTESKSKFVKASCNTTHSLAFQAIGRRFAHRLNGERVRSEQVASMLGIQKMDILLSGMGTAQVCECAPDERASCERCKGAGAIKTDKIRTLSAGFLAGQLLVAVRRFCQSDERQISGKFVAYINGIDFPTEDGKRTYANNDRVKAYLEPFLATAWEDLSAVDGVLPFNHDVYVKVWQLGQGVEKPVISANYILLDEAQDTAPVFLDVLKQQKHALLVLVGDDNQQIYEWRGAVNAMGAFQNAPRCLLSQSYRFGQAIADVANSILDTLEEPTDLVMRGNPEVLSRVAPVDNPNCYLYRTNASAISQLMAELEMGRKPHLVGKVDDIVSWCQAAMDLQQGRKTRHADLCCFDSWSEVEEYSATDEGSEMRLMVRLVKKFGAQSIRDALKNMVPENEADVVLSTAHRSKGREWDTVKLGGDFPTADRMNDSDRRLLYVAVTRAKVTLDTSSCPPIAGGNEFPGDESSEWIPGLRINYTQQMPTKEEQAAWLKLRDAQLALKEAEKQAVVKAAPVSTQRPKDGYGWTKFGDQWCVRGPINGAPGDEILIRKRDNSTQAATIKSILRKFDDAWIYGV